MPDRIGDGGIPKIVLHLEASTEPSRYRDLESHESGGRARIAFGQYKSWVLGDYHGDNALVQAARYHDLSRHRRSSTSAMVRLPPASSVSISITATIIQRTTRDDHPRDAWSGA